MNFLNIGPWELTAILILAILLVGPKRVIELVQTIRRLAGKLSRLSGEFTSMIQSEVRSTEQGAGEILQEATGGKTGETLGDVVKDVISPISGLQAELQATALEARRSLENIVKSQSGLVGDIQTELQAAAQETRRALESPAEDEPKLKETQDETLG